MRRMIFLVLVMLLLATGCGGEGGETESTYQQITQEEAKEIMDAEDGAMILDVREQSEYDEGHIPGAVLFPVDTINKDTAAAVIPEQDTVLLVYCRSGNRSKTASAALAELGYTQVFEFGGINSWPYDIEQ